jgi:hypothetical protein
MNDYKPLIGRRVLVFTDFLTFDGTLVRVGRDPLGLEQAHAVANDGGRQPIDGDTLVPAARVLWVQVP